MSDGLGFEENRKIEQSTMYGYDFLVNVTKMTVKMAKNMDVSNFGEFYFHYLL